MRDLAARQTLFPLLCLAAPLRTGCPTLLLRMDFRQVFRYAGIFRCLTDFIPCALRPRPLLQSVAHPQVGVHSGYSREPYAFARLAHYSPYLFSEESAFLHTPPTINGNFHSGYSRLTVNLRSAGHLFSLLIALRRPFPRYGSFRYADTGMAIRGPHEVILPEVIIVLHFSPCWYLLRTFLRSDKLRPNGGKLLTISNSLSIGNHWTPQLCPGLPAAPRR